MIEVKNVTKKYGSTIAVDNISFDVKDGEVVGFLGPNGAGKSTTMNMITGFIDPTQGQIIVNGNDISKKPRKAKKDIGYMPENVPLYYELTPKEFVTYMAELKLVKKAERKEEVQKVINEMGLAEVQNKLIRNLSRGFKQRVSMAGALVGNPDVIILDEPTVGLDPKQITEIRNLIKELGKKHTVILSTHILSEASQICEKVVIINKGKIIAVDTPENLEKATKEKNSISLIVEDPKGNMEKLKEKITQIDSVDFVRDCEDGTKQYIVTTSADIDLRKKLFEILPKEEIVIFELKKTENTLEDAFIKLIDANKQEIEEPKDKTNKIEQGNEEKDTNPNNGEGSTNNEKENLVNATKENSSLKDETEEESKENKNERENIEDEIKENDNNKESIEDEIKENDNSKESIEDEAKKNDNKKPDAKEEKK